MSYLAELHAAHKARQLRFQKAGQRTKKVLIKPTVRNIVGMIASFYDLPARTLKNSFSKKVVRCRYLAYYICKHVLKFSHKQISLILKVNTNIITIFNEMLSNDPLLVLDLKTMKGKINFKFKCNYV